MATRSMANVFEITYGTSNAGMLNPTRSEVLTFPGHEAEASEDGLGAIRALSFAMAFNVVLVALAFGAWELWKYWL